MRKNARRLAMARDCYEAVGPDRMVHRAPRGWLPQGISSSTRIRAMSIPVPSEHYRDFRVA